MSEITSGKGDKKELLKGMIKRLHNGENFEQVKREFEEKIGDISPSEIGRIEEELIRDGMPQEEIHRLCDIHLAMFAKFNDEAQEIAPAGHPIHVLMEEHKLLLAFAAQLRKTAAKVAEADNNADSQDIDAIKELIEKFRSSVTHYLREENVLFAYLEKHGITQPPAVMWMEHDSIREIEKNLYSIGDAYLETKSLDLAQRLADASLALAEMLTNHFRKENNILYPASLEVIGANEWADARQQFDEIGYCPFTPQEALEPFGTAGAPSPAAVPGNSLVFETGSMTRDEIEAVFNTLPFDITFVNKDDEVQFYSNSDDRVFVRTKAVIGRKVQQCHPQKSIHIVNQILDDFRNGARDSAEFWINLDGRLILIQYFPVRDGNNNYLGCIEVTKDITDIKKLEGEKRLL